MNAEYFGEGEKMTWRNRAQQFGQPNEIGQRTRYWDPYSPGDLLGVYDRDNLQHLANLAYLHSRMMDDVARSRIPSRDT